MYNLVRALKDVFEGLGGVIETDAEVEQIVVENRKAKGVLVKGQFYEADGVISNADLAHTYGELIGSEHRRRWSNKKLRKTQYSMSAFLLYLGVKKKYPQLAHHTLILSERYKGLVTDIFDNKVLPDDFSMYLHIPSQTDPAMAPKGCESMYVLIPVPNLESRINWEKAKQKVCRQSAGFLGERLWSDRSEAFD